MLEGDQISFRPTLAELMLEWVYALVEEQKHTPLLGISGAQGIGKTTSLEQIRKASDINVAVLSLDDFYLPKADRLELAKNIHPLCATRGSPGTHDLDLLRSTIARLRSNGSDLELKWPLFDKAADDRAEEVHWNSFSGRPDAILVEGWLIGALSDPEMMKEEPVNILEAESDSAGLWRTWQFGALRSEYEPFWREFDAFLHLRAPSFEVVQRWRCEQEETTLGLEKGALPVEKRQWVIDFIQYYERVTRRMLAGSHIEGMIFELDEGRSVKRLING